MPITAEQARQELARRRGRQTPQASPRRLGGGGERYAPPAAWESAARTPLRYPNATDAAQIEDQTAEEARTNARANGSLSMADLPAGRIRRIGAQEQRQIEIDTEVEAARQQARREYSALPDQASFVTPIVSAIADPLEGAMDRGRENLGIPGAREDRIERDRRWARGARQAGSDILDEGHGGHLMDWAASIPEAMRQDAANRTRADSERELNMYDRSLLRSVAEPIGDFWTGMSAIGRDARGETAAEDARRNYASRDYELAAERGVEAFNAGDMQAAGEADIAARSAARTGRTAEQRGDAAAGTDFWINGPWALEFAPEFGMVQSLARFPTRVGLRAAGQEVPEALARPNLLSETQAAGPATQNARGWRNNTLLGGGAYLAADAADGNIGDDPGASLMTAGGAMALGRRFIPNIDSAIPADVAHLSRQGEIGADGARNYTPRPRQRLTVDPEGRVAMDYEGSFNTGDGASVGETRSVIRGAREALDRDIADTRRSEYSWTPNDERQAALYRGTFERDTPTNYAFSETPQANGQPLQRLRRLGAEFEPDPLQAQRVPDDAPYGFEGAPRAPEIIDAEATPTVPRNFEAAVRDPETGRVYTGPDHNAAIDSIPDEATRARLQAVYDAPTEDANAIGFSVNGQFMGREEGLQSLRSQRRPVRVGEQVNRDGSVTPRDPINWDAGIDPQRSAMADLRLGIEDPGRMSIVPPGGIPGRSAEDMLREPRRLGEAAGGNARTPDWLVRNPNDADLAQLAERGDELKYVMDTDGNVYAFSAADGHHNQAMRALRDSGVNVRPLGAGAEVTDPDAAGFIWRNSDGTFTHEDANMVASGPYGAFQQRVRPQVRSGPEAGPSQPTNWAEMQARVDALAARLADEAAATKASSEGIAGMRADATASQQRMQEAARRAEALLADVKAERANQTPAPATTEAYIPPPRGETLEQMRERLRRIEENAGITARTAPDGGPLRDGPNAGPRRLGDNDAAAIAAVTGAGGGYVAGKLLNGEAQADDGSESGGDPLLPILGAGAGAATLTALRRGRLGQSSRSQVGMFAGVNARTADRAALARAEELAASGASRDAIWQETGWFQGVDGKWRFEIDDSGARVAVPPRAPYVSELATQYARENFGVNSIIDIPLNDVRRQEAMQWAQMRAPSIADQRAQSWPLNDVLDHPEMRAAYGMDDVTFGREMEAGLQGSYSPTTRRVRAIDEPAWLGGPEADPRSTVLHEVQHYTQEAEGFARGGDPRGVYESEITRLNARMTALVREQDTLRSVINGGNTGVDTAPYAARLEEAKAEYRAAMAEREALADPKARMEGYRRLAGETEARNVQTRRDFTPEERRSRAPWETQDVPDDQQIVRFDGGRAESRPRRLGQDPVTELNDAGAQSGNGARTEADIPREWPTDPEQWREVMGTHPWINSPSRAQLVLMASARDEAGRFLYSAEDIAARAGLASPESLNVLLSRARSAGVDIPTRPKGGGGATRMPGGDRLNRAVEVLESAVRSGEPMTYTTLDERMGIRPGSSRAWLANALNNPAVPDALKARIRAAIEANPRTLGPRSSPDAAAVAGGVVLTAGGALLASDAQASPDEDVINRGRYLEARVGDEDPKPRIPAEMRIAGSIGTGLIARNAARRLGATGFVREGAGGLVAAGADRFMGGSPEEAGAMALATPALRYAGEEGGRRLAASIDEGIYRRAQQSLQWTDYDHALANEPMHQQRVREFAASLPGEAPSARAIQAENYHVDVPREADGMAPITVGDREAFDQGYSRNIPGTETQSPRDEFLAMTPGQQEAWMNRQSATTIDGDSERAARGLQVQQMVRDTPQQPRLGGPTPSRGMPPMNRPTRGERTAGTVLRRAGSRPAGQTMDGFIEAARQEGVEITPAARNNKARASAIAEAVRNNPRLEQLARDWGLAVLLTAGGVAALSAADDAEASDGSAPQTDRAGLATGALAASVVGGGFAIAEGLRHPGRMRLGQASRVSQVPFHEPATTLLARGARRLESNVDPRLVAGGTALAAGPVAWGTAELLDPTAQSPQEQEASFLRDVMPYAELRQQALELHSQGYTSREIRDINPEVADEMLALEQGGNSRLNDYEISPAGIPEDIQAARAYRAREEQKRTNAQRLGR